MRKSLVIIHIDSGNYWLLKLKTKGIEKDFHSESPFMFTLWLQHKKMSEGKI